MNLYINFNTAPHMFYSTCVKS